MGGDAGAAIGHLTGEEYGVDGAVEGHEGVEVVEVLGVFLKGGSEVVVEAAPKFGGVFEGYLVSQFFFGALCFHRFVFGDTHDGVAIFVG